MNLNNPVEVSRFFTREMKPMEEGHWLLSLSPSGQFRELIGPFEPSLENLSHIMRHHHFEQLVLVRICHGSAFICDKDWILLTELQHLLRPYDVELVDLIKISKEKCDWLSRYELF